MLILLLSVLCVGLSGAQVILSGQCNTSIPVEPNFNIERFAGRWRLISTYPNPRQSGTCNQANYVQRGNVLDLVNSHVVNQTLLTATGTATLAIDGSAKFTVNIGTNTPIDYWILGTDYNTYALAYSCQNMINNQQRIWSWKLSRTTSLTTQANNNINDIINSLSVLDNANFVNADQSDAACFYYPELETNEPVIFPGQCNLNIPVVNNFNMTRFQGEWILISSYYAERQSGTCNRVQYSQRGNILDLVNSHVVNRALLSTSGTATAATTDGRLVVNIGTNPAVDYFILDTDYDTYTLAYSCENINNAQRRIWSWKMSRTTSLTSQAIQNMDRVINDIDVLDNRYFQNANQTDAGCFFYPDFQPNEPVVFPGQCNLNIPVVNNFNLTRFQGEWILISSYYAERQSGTCNRVQYTQRGNILDLVNSHVVNQTLLSTSGTATPTSTDGRLVVNIGTNPAVDYFILDTDYDTYTLAYSCENINNAQRRIWSWKMSRTTSLTSQAVQNIDRVIGNIDVLDNRYFQNADQTDAACFSFPDIQPNEPVILPGQCNPDIPVVNNFNLTRFQGEWILISSYYAERQSGTCNRAQYTQRGNILDLVNSHVVNQTLLSTSGTATPTSTDGRLVVNIGTNPAVDFLILDTDYDSYTLAYSCENISSTEQRIWSWKLSRTTSLTNQANQNIDRVMNNIDVLDNRFFQNADQSDAACFYLPDIPLGEDVIFPGQCDPNIAVVTNFNLTAFLGDWRLMSTYYTRRQSGTCNQVNYSLDGTTIRVVNKHVVSQSLLSVSGTASVATTDGSGKLTVSISRRTVDFWILATDYSDYALAYYCSNLDNNRQRIYSWKLSRGRSLSAQANTALERVINNVNVLNERYYETANHTDAGCFYFPAANPNAPVIFPGQCDTSVRAAYNFNVSAFLGVWHEIEIYPTGLDIEQCATQEYTQVSGTTLNMAARFIQNEVQNQNTWTLVRSSSDTTGSFIATIQTGGVTMTFPFWILSTDYTNYAFAYACVNVNADSRRVYSWKLSRTKQLSSAANTAIASAMSTVEVLDERYFKALNHSDADCFYLPELAEGATVVLPGQCDVNIPVVQNFDVDKYSGTWYQIERYPQRFESGRCTGARYALNDGVVTVLNWQEIDGVLDTIEGTATIISTDGSAKLRVNLSRGESDRMRTMDLYVLDTDYSTYSLAYSCVNVDAHYRAIGAWKLSRTRTMPAAGNNAINAYMAPRQELHSRYFISVEQNDSCPEPSSAMLVKSSITVLFLLCLALINLS